MWHRSGARTHHSRIWSTLARTLQHTSTTQYRVQSISSSAAVSLLPVRGTSTYYTWRVSAPGAIYDDMREGHIHVIQLAIYIRETKHRSKRGRYRYGILFFMNMYDGYFLGQALSRTTSSSSSSSSSSSNDNSSSAMYEEQSYGCTTKLV